MRKIVVFVLCLVMLVCCTACTVEDADVAYPDDSGLYLTLVNKDHVLPEGWYDMITLMDVKNCYKEDFSVEKETYSHFVQLLDDLSTEDVYIEIDSACRTVDEQMALWERFEKEYGEDYCEKYLAEPGYSEHHTGLAIDIFLIKDGEDIRDNEAMLAETELFAKVHERLADYGFILRYPEGKEDITGYSYEPWHIRYVGEEAAKEIYEQNLTLEEYYNMIYNG